MCVAARHLIVHTRYDLNRPAGSAIPIATPRSVRLWPSSTSRAGRVRVEKNMTSPITITVSTRQVKTNGGKISVSRLHRIPLIFMMPSYELGLKAVQSMIPPRPSARGKIGGRSAGVVDRGRASTPNVLGPKAKAMPYSWGLRSY